MEQVKKEKPVIKLKLITGNAKLLKAISDVALTGKKLETLIHTVAVSVIVHIEKHREVSLANKLIDAVPNLARKNALRDWFISFGKMTYDKETQGMMFNKAGKTNEIEATQNPFWVFVPEKDYVPFDLVSAVNELIKRAEAKANKANKLDKIPTTILTQLKKVVNG
jgi:uncharacterized protein (DUF1697 family)